MIGTKGHAASFSGSGLPRSSISIVPEQVVIMESPEDNDGSEGTESEARSTTCSSLYSEAGREALRHSGERRYIRAGPSPTDSQAVRKLTPSINMMGSEFKDPFLTLPNLAGGDTDILTHHWQTVFVETTTVVGPRKLWLPFSIGDSALFHGIMHISAAHLAALQRSRPSPAYFQHRGEVIRLINKRITYDQNATSDGTLGAIACLLISDTMSGHSEHARAHVLGLQQLVSARGCISNLHPLTQRAVRWSALLASITFLERPLFCPPQMIETNLNTYYGPPSFSTTSYAQAFYNRLVNFTGRQEPAQLAASILWGLRNLSVLKEPANMGDSLSYESISYSDRVELLERQTENLLHDTLERIEPTNVPKKPSPGFIFILFAYATLIYINSIFRDMVPSYTTFTLAQRLELSMDIEDVELNILLGTFPELMLWILFLGGGAARSKSRIWFAKTASKILRVQKVEEEKGITVASTSFLWPEGRENYDDTTGHDLEMTDASEVEIAFASLMPSTDVTP